MTLDAAIREAVREAVAPLVAEFASLRASLAKPTRDPDERLTVEQAAEADGCTPAAIYKRIKRGQLVAERMGRSLRIRRGSL